MLLFSQRITNVVLSEYQACFTSKLSLLMIQEPWAFPPRKENTEDCLNFWALWALPSASLWLARSSELFNTSALSHSAPWCSSIKPVRISTPLSIPVLSQLKNSSKGLEAGRKKILKSNFLERVHPYLNKRKNRLLSSFSSPKESSQNSQMISPCPFSMKVSKGWTFLWSAQMWHTWIIFFSPG